MRRLASLLVLSLLIVAVSATSANAETLPEGQKYCPKVPTEFLKKLCTNELDPKQGTFGAIGTSVIETAAGTAFRSNATGAKEELQKWALERVGKLFSVIDESTAPDLSADWFKTHYFKTAGIATAIMGFVFLLTLLFGGITMSRRAISHALLGALMAGLVIGTAPILTTIFLKFTDAIASSLSLTFGGDVRAFLDGVAYNLTHPDPNLPAAAKDAGRSLSTLTVAFAAMAVGISAAIMWLALKLASLVVYVAIGLVALVAVRSMLPGGERAVRRIASIVMTMGIAKIVVMAVVSLGIGIAAAVGTNQEPTDKLIDAAALLAVGGLTPVAFLAALPSIGAYVHHARVAAHPIQRPLMTGRNWARSQASGWASARMNGARPTMRNGNRQMGSGRAALATTGMRPTPTNPGNQPAMPNSNNESPKTNEFVPAALKARLPKRASKTLPNAIPLAPHEANPPTPIGGSPRTPNHSLPRRFDGR